MKARVKSSGEVLSLGENKYQDDGAEVIGITLPKDYVFPQSAIHPVHGYDLRKLEYKNGTLVARSQGERDQIDTDDGIAAVSATELKARLDADLADPSQRGGLPDLNDKVNDLISYVLSK